MPNPAPGEPRDKPPRERSVFINCPFDADYKPLLRAGCFAVLASGYEPRCALNLSDSGAVRFEEIVGMISECDFSIHDISRVELDRESRLPRFNMPLELGADLGLRLRGPKPQRRRKLLVLNAEKHRYDKTLSDISGMDIEVHGNDPRKIVLCIRDWLNANQRPGSRSLPGVSAMYGDYEAYREIAPDIARELRLDAPDDLHHVDFLRVVAIALPKIAAANTDSSTA